MLKNRGYARDAKFEGHLDHTFYHTAIIKNK